MGYNGFAVHLLQWWIWYAGLAILVICLLAKMHRLFLVALAVLIAAWFAFRQ